MLTFAIIFFSLIIAYMILNLIMHRIPEVEAGPTEGLKSTGSKHISDNIPPSYKKKDEKGDVSIHRNFIVRGNCMSPKGIKDGSTVDIKVIKKSDRPRIKEKLEKDQIVLISLNDERFRGYKLRIIKDLRDTDALTYYYKGDQIEDSSRPHAYKDIIGVLYSHT